jgi:hypothetical protein
VKACFLKRVSIERRNSLFIVTLGILKPFLQSSEANLGINFRLKVKDATFYYKLMAS